MGLRAGLEAAAKIKQDWNAVLFVYTEIPKMYVRQHHGSQQVASLITMARRTLDIHHSYLKGITKATVVSSSNILDRQPVHPPRRPHSRKEVVVKIDSKRTRTMFSNH
jgi:hypothetical protein